MINEIQNEDKTEVFLREENIFSTHQYKSIVSKPMWIRELIKNNNNVRFNILLP